MKTPLDVFFETLSKKYSKEEAMHAIKTEIVKRKLQIKVSTTGEASFTELWNLTVKEKVLRKISSQASKEDVKAGHLLL